MGLPHASVDLDLCQLRIFPSLNKAFSKSAIGPLVCLVLRIHAIAGISNALVIPQNREYQSRSLAYMGKNPTRAEDQKKRLAYDRS
jgi:hypothetical protein